MSLTKVSFSMIEGATLNVKDYGAVGNGIADDTAAIEAAVAAANPSISGSFGKTVFFPSGTYIYNGSGITLRGLMGLKGESDTTIKCSGDFATLTNNYYLTIQNLQIVGNGGNSSVGTGIAIQSSVGLKNLLIDRVRICGFEKGIYFTAAYQGNITNINVEYCDIGVHLEQAYLLNGQFWIVHHCATAHIKISGRSSFYTNVDCSYGAGDGIQMEFCEGVSFAGVYMEGVSGTMINFINSGDKNCGFSNCDLNFHVNGQAAVKMGSAGVNTDITFQNMYMTTVGATNCIGYDFNTTPSDARIVFLNETYYSSSGGGSFAAAVYGRSWNGIRIGDDVAVIAGGYDVVKMVNYVQGTDATSPSFRLLTNSCNFDNDLPNIGADQYWDLGYLRDNIQGYYEIFHPNLGSAIYYVDGSVAPSTATAGITLVKGDAGFIVGQPTASTSQVGIFNSTTSGRNVFKLRNAFSTSKLILIKSYKTI